MPFSSKQIQELKRNIKACFVRSRLTSDGRELSYLEGWHAIAEANRIFGHDGWNRETVETKCVLAREAKGTFYAAYLAKVRITVRADSENVIREGYGTGEASGASVGDAHEKAIKTAETDATKRALATFGKPFGLALYVTGRSGRKQPRVTQVRSAKNSSKPVADQDRRRTRQELSTAGRYFVPPRPKTVVDTAWTAAASETSENAESNDPSGMASAIEGAPSSTRHAEPHPVAGSPESAAPQTNEKVAPLFRPRRHREPEHLKAVGQQPCLLCGRMPSDAHHLRFAQPRALGRKVSDEFTVPLCRTHHRQLHQSGNEVAWWVDMGIDPLPIAQDLWTAFRRNATDIAK